MKIVFSILILFSSLLLKAQEISISNPMILWYNRPAMIEHSVNYKGKVLLGYVDNDKKVNVAVLKNDLLDTTICLHEYDKPTSDDHGSPAILELKNKIVAFHSWHTSELYQTTYDCQSREMKTTIIDSLATYNQVFQFKNGRIVLLYNKTILDSNKRRISLRYSDDETQTWSDEIVVLDTKDNECPYFVANVKGTKIVVAYTLYNASPTSMQHKNLYLPTSNSNLSLWNNSYENLSLPIKESKPIYVTPDSIDINIFDVNIKRKTEVLFTTFEPYYSENRFQNAKLYLFNKERKAQYIGKIPHFCILPEVSFTKSKLTM